MEEWAKARAKAVPPVTAVKAAVPVKVKVGPKVAVKMARAAVSKVAARDKVLAMPLKAVAHRAVAVVLAAEPVAAADRTPYRRTSQMVAMTTSLRANCVKQPCRNRIRSCARNSGRSIAITRRARADVRNHSTLDSYSLESR